MKIFVLRQTTKIILRAAKCTAYTIDPNYSRFKATISGPMEAHMIKLMYIAEQLLKLISSKPILKKAPFVDDEDEDFLKECALEAQQIINLLDECHACATKHAYIPPVVVSLVFHQFHQKIMDLTHQRYDHYLFQSLVLVHTDDVVVEKREDRNGPNSELVGACENTGPFHLGATPTEEASLAVMSGLLDQNRIAVDLDPHHKKGATPVLANQFERVVQCFFEWCGLWEVIIAWCQDHAKSNTAAAESISRYLFSNDPRQQRRDQVGPPAAELAVKNPSSIPSSMWTIFIKWQMARCGHEPKTHTSKYWQNTFKNTHTLFNEMLFVLRTTCHLLKEKFGTLTHFNLEIMSLAHTARDVVPNTYDGSTSLHLNPNRSVALWPGVDQMDNILEEFHNQVKQLPELLVDLANQLHGHALRGRQKEKETFQMHKNNLVDGGLTKALDSFLVVDINIIFRVLKEKHQLVKDFPQMKLKITAIKKIIQANKVRVGELSMSRALYFYYFTKNTTGVISFLVCTVHLFKAEVGVIVRSTPRRPFFVPIDESDFNEFPKWTLEKLLKGMKKDESRAMQAQKTQDAADLAANMQSLADSVAGRVDRTPKTFQEDDDKEECDFDKYDTECNCEFCKPRRQQMDDEYVQDPLSSRFPSHCAEIHADLVQYLFIINGAFILAQLGSPGRYIRQTDWTPNAFGAMDPGKGFRLCKSMNFIELVIRDVYTGVEKDGVLKPVRIPWEILQRAVPELQPPTHKQILGLVGLLKIARRFKAVFIDFLLSRQFSAVKRLDAAKLAHSAMVQDHMLFNPYCRSDNVQGKYFSRYQLIEGQSALMIFFEKLIIKQTSINLERVQVNAMGNGVEVGYQNPILVKIGLHQNSTVENKIGCLRWLKTNGNLTGADLKYIWRRFIHRQTRARGRLSPGRRQEYDQIQKDIQWFVENKPNADRLAIANLIQYMVEFLEEEREKEVVMEEEEEGDDLL
jgi:hypothetical protein